MCGQAGIIFGKKRRWTAERRLLGEVFTRMLLGCQVRGPHATGAAVLRSDGDYRLFKRPVLAEELVKEPTYIDIINSIENDTAILMGHTRWRTRGHEKNSRNNHPLRCGVYSARITAQSIMPTTYSTSSACRDSLRSIVR